MGRKRACDRRGTLRIIRHRGKAFRELEIVPSLGFEPSQSTADAGLLAAGVPTTLSLGDYLSLMAF
jgi:hypothetical protein